MIQHKGGTTNVLAHKYARIHIHDVVIRVIILISNTCILNYRNHSTMNRHFGSSRGWIVGASSSGPPAPGQ